MSWVARSFTEFTPGNRWVGGGLLLSLLLSSPLVIDGLGVLGLLLSSPLVIDGLGVLGLLLSSPLVIDGLGVLFY